MKKYIDAEGVMRVCYDGFIKTGAKAYREIFALLEAAPAEDVQEVRHGRWEQTKELYSKDGGLLFFGKACSICGNIADEQYNYCPNCGAYMDKEENE